MSRLSFRFLEGPGRLPPVCYDGGHGTTPFERGVPEACYRRDIRPSCQSDDITVQEISADALHKNAPLGPFSGRLLTTQSKSLDRAGEL